MIARCSHCRRLCYWPMHKQICEPYLRTLARIDEITTYWKKKFEEAP